MKSSYKFMQGASKSTGKSLEIKAFLLVILFYVPNFVPKNKRVSSKTRYLSNTRFHRKNHLEGGSFLSIVHYSACKLVHEVNVLQGF